MAFSRGGFGTSAGLRPTSRQDQMDSLGLSSRSVDDLVQIIGMSGISMNQARPCESEGSPAFCRS